MAEEYVDPLTEYLIRATGPASAAVATTLVSDEPEPARPAPERPAQGRPRPVAGTADQPVRQDATPEVERVAAAGATTAPVTGSAGTASTPAATVSPAAAVSASAAPRREAGTRSRAGNAMDRTRAALLDGARTVIARNGTRITMADVAATAGVAKATLYNHLRTREDVLRAVLDHEIAAIAHQAADLPLDRALRATAEAISTHPLRATLADSEPATIAQLSRVIRSAPGWGDVATAVDAALARHGCDGTDEVLRWLASLLINPLDSAGIERAVTVLLDGLPSAAGRSTDASVSEALAAPAPRL